MANWHSITGYEGLYSVSDAGEVKSHSRTVKTWYRTQHRTEKLLTQFERGRDGIKYNAVALTKDGVTKYLSVHRLVAQAFIPNPNNLPEVNHIDRNTKNNSVSNLEWCTREYNEQYSHEKVVVQYSLDGDEVARYRSVTEAARKTGIGRRSIYNVLNGWSLTAGKYNWHYA